jgi:glycosyltransferase involved in cell wall biosynthesis
MPPDRMVSVLMPAYEAAAYIGESIESALAQTHHELELIVVDDGSTDGSDEIARSYGAPVRVATQQHAGEGRARAHAARLATGAYIASLDADDLWPARKLELQLAALEDPEVDLVFGHQHQFRSPELGPEQGTFAGEGETVPSLLAGAMLVSRANFDRVGSYSHHQIGPAMDWLLRARELGLRERMLPEVVLRRRLHPSSHTMRSRDQFGDYARILKASLDRRRSAG